MTKKLRRTWRSLAFRAKLLVALVALLCSAAFAGTLAMENAFIPWGDSGHIGTNDDIIGSNFPSWFGAAFKTGSGVWDTNIPAWTVPTDETNDAALEVLFNPSLLTNSLIVNLGYRDFSNSSLSIDVLHMTNQSVMPSTLIENLLTGSGSDTSRTFNVPLDPNAVGLQFRRGTGAIMIRDTLLSPDSDGDGYSDSEELAWGSDPGSALSVPCSAITGQIYYAGVQSGVLHVLAATNAADWASAYYMTISLPISTHVASFTLSGLPLRGTYYTRAWLDANDNQSKDSWEPSGMAVPASLHLGGNTGSVVIAMSDPDSDGDGMSDVDEMQLGLDPFVSNAFSKLPFLERFETDTVHLGDVNGQNGWITTSSNTVMVQTGVVWEGAQALALKSLDAPADVVQFFAVSNAPVVWADTHILALPGSTPTNPVSGSAMAFLDDDGYLRVYDGMCASTNKWLTLTNLPPRAMTGEWVRLSVKLDYGTQRWLACVDGLLACEEIGFATPVSQFNMVSLKGERGVMDALYVSTNEPAGLSLDYDQLPDDWEMAHFSNFNQNDNGDPDNDGLSNLEEYQHGTDPANPDTDGDGMSDGWEVIHGFNPTNPADAALDADGDGLSNLGECVAGTDPRNAASHCWSIAGMVSYTGPQTGLLWIAACTSATGWSIVSQVATVSTGEYVIANVPPNSNYWIKAWRDTDGNNSNDFWEACGTYTNQSISLFTNVTGINFALSDPDSDGDGMPDWWEIAHGFNPFDPADAAQDADGDGLSNRAEYSNGTDPYLADTDHDGIADGLEVQNGSNPKVANNFTQFPFIERFETNTVHLGDVNGQNGWIASPSNTVMVQTGIVWEGSQALSIKAGDTQSSVCQLFAVSNAPVVWADTHILALPGSTPTNPVSGSAMAFLDDDGYLRVYDGMCASTNKWLTLTNLPPRAMTGEWVRLSVKLDYGTQRWLACVDGLLACEEIGFATPVSQFNMVSLKGERGVMDALYVSTNEPAGLSLDYDQLPDDWEMAHFSNFNQNDNGDPDNDGLSNLEEYRHGTDPNFSDTDHDGMSDGWEVAHGFNPLVNDAALDPDHDGLTNLQEYLLGTDPHNADTDGDGLSDGDEVNIYYTNPLLADTDGDGMPDKWEIVHGLNPLVPSDGALDPDGDGLNNLQEYQLGTDPYKFDTDGDGLVDGLSGVVTTNMYPAGVVDANAPGFVVGELSYSTSPINPDTDGDGMPDGWEVAHGFNPLEPSDAAQDADGDGFINRDEYLYGTDPHNPDTDGDGMSDGFEVLVAHSNPLVKDFNGTIVSAAPAVNGDAAIGWIGDWALEDGFIYARERSGYVDYVLPVPSNGTFAVAVNVAQNNALTSQGIFDLSLDVDGIFTGRQIVNAPFGSTANAIYFLPELVAGTHALRIRWNNKDPNTFLQINSVQLQVYGGPDADTNGISDWLDYRLANLSKVDQQTQASVVSPVCFEGKAVYLDQLTIIPSYAPEGQSQQVVSVQHGIRDDWYANVFVSPTNDTQVVITDQSSGMVRTNIVTWEAINLLDNVYSNGLAIRGGSSLLLAARPAESANGMFTLTIWNGTNVVTNMVAAAGSSVPYCFGQAGIFTVSGSCSNETTITNGTLSVRVVTGSFNGREADCATGQARTWDCPDITTSAVVTADNQLSVSSTNLSGGGTRFTLMNPTDGPLYMVARLGAGGIILDSAKISSIYGDHGTYFKVVETFADGSRLVEVRLQLGYVPSDLTVKLSIFVGGVTFLDGTIIKTLTAADFNELGVCTYRMLQSASSHSSTCHATKIYQNGLYIGGN